MNEQLKQVYEEYRKMKKQPTEKKEIFLGETNLKETVIYETDKIGGAINE